MHERRTLPPRIPRKRSAGQKVYPAWDIAIRTISAVGVLVIGAATWMLQWQINRDRIEETTHGKQIQLDLAKARSLLGLELALRDLTMFVPGNDEVARQRCAQRVIFAARSILDQQAMPLGAEADREIRRVWGSYGHPITVRMAAVALAESLQLFGPNGAPLTGNTVRVTEDRAAGMVAVMSGRTVVLMRGVSEESFPLWSSMITGSSTGFYLHNWNASRSAAEALANNIAQTAGDLIVRNPDVATAYFELRTQAAANRDSACAPAASGK